MFGTYLRLIYAFIKAFWILFVQFPHLDRKSQGSEIQKWSAETLKLLGVSVEVIGDIDITLANRPYLIVANHISWLDPLVIQTLQHSIFVAKHEVSQWPIVGHIAKGCEVVFVDRGSASSARKMVQSMTDVLQRNMCIAGFPEGTSTEGRQVGLFHSNLFEAAVTTNCKVIALSLRYKDPDTQAIRLEPAFVGEISFLQSLHQVICAPPMVVQVVVSSPIAPQGHTRRTLAHFAQGKVESQLRLL